MWGSHILPLTPDNAEREVIRCPDFEKNFMHLFEKDFFCAKGIFYCPVYIFISIAETQRFCLPENVGWVERSVTHRLPVRIFTEGYVILPYLSQKRRVFVF